MNDIQSFKKNHSCDTGVIFLLLIFGVSGTTRGYFNEYFYYLILLILDNQSKLFFYFTCN